MNKKGILGLNTTTQFIVTLLVLAVTAFAVIIALSTLGDTEAANLNQPIVRFNNESTIAMNFTNPYQLSGTGSLNSCVATIDIVINSTDSAFINSDNYTVSGCTVTADVNTLLFNNTIWKLTGTYAHKSNKQVTAITDNVSIGVSNFFGNSTTWFSLLAIVVILLIIAIVIITVRRFEVGGMGEGGLTQTRSDVASL